MIYYFSLSIWLAFQKYTIYGLMFWNHVHEFTYQQGRSRMEKLMVHDIWRVPANECIVVIFNKNGQTIKAASVLLVRFINILVIMTTFSISFHLWDKIPGNYKVTCFEKIKVIDYSLFFNYIILTLWTWYHLIFSGQIDLKRWHSQAFLSTESLRLNGEIVVSIYFTAIMIMV